MPMYEYKCRACGHSFERYAAGRGEQTEVGSCPKCGKGKPEKLFSTFASSCCGTGLATPGSGGCGGGSSSFS